MSEMAEGEWWDVFKAFAIEREKKLSDFKEYFWLLFRLQPFCEACYCSRSEQQLFEDIRGSILAFGGCIVIILGVSLSWICWNNYR